MPSCSTCAQTACCVFAFWVKSTIYILWCCQISDRGWFYPAFGSHLRCGYEPLPPNQTGLKVLNIGIAKTGTRTTSRALHEIGFKSYHSGDIMEFAWHPLARDYWGKPENGGYLQPPIRVFYRDDPLYDKEVVAGTPNFPEVWAEGVSRCRVDALTFDGTEELIWTTIDSSPDAKVLLTDWRTYAQWRNSFSGYVVREGLVVFLSINMHIGLHFLPWNIFYHITEPLFKGPLERMFTTGDPPMSEFQTPIRKMFVLHYFNTRVAPHVDGGLSEIFRAITNEAEYEAFWERLRKRVPPERRMRVDPRKTKYEDLCAFLELSPCKKSGRLAKAVDLASLERNFFPAHCLLMPIMMVVHWVNWQLLYWVCGHLKRGAKGALALLGAR